MVHSIIRKPEGGNVVLIVDMAKSYDRVDWHFLSWVIESFGFSDNVCKLISECVETPWFSIMMNATFKGFLKSYWGLR